MQIEKLQMKHKKNAMEVINEQKILTNKEESDSNGVDLVFCGA